MAIGTPRIASADAGAGNPAITPGDDGVEVKYGDVLVASIHMNGAANTVTDNNGSTPFTSDHYRDSSDSARHYVFSRVAGHSEPTTYNWTAGAGGRWSVILVVVPGVDNDDHWEVAPSNSSSDLESGAASSPATAPTITITNSGALGLVFVSGDTNPTTITWGSPTNSYADEVDQSGQQSQACYYRADLDAGATGTTSVTPSGNEQWIAWQLALKASGTSRADDRLSYEPDYTLKLGSPTSQTATIYASEAGEVSCSDAAYANARDGSGTVIFRGDQVIYCTFGQDVNAGGTDWVYQTFLDIDLSNFPPSTEFTAATFSLNISSDNSTTDFVMQLRFFDYGTSIATADFIDGADLSSCDLAASLTTNGVSTGAYTALTSEADFYSLLRPGQVNRFVLVSQETVDNSAPADAENVVIKGTVGPIGGRPKLVVTYNAALGEDITPDVELDTIIVSSGMRGFGALEFGAPVEDVNDVVSPHAVAGTDVVLYDHGATAFEGEITRADKPNADVPWWRFSCSGYWDRARRTEGFRKVFVDSEPYQRCEEIPVEVWGDPDTLARRNDAITIDTDGQLLAVLPDNTDYDADQGVMVAYRILDGLSVGQTISRVTSEYSVNPGSEHHARLYTCSDVWGDAAAITSLISVDPASQEDDDVDSDVSSDDATCLVLAFYSDSSATTTEDRYIQLRKLVVYSGTQAKRTVDEAIVEVIVTDTAIAASSSTTTIGSALDHLVCESGTVDDAVRHIEAQNDAPVLAGIWDDITLHVKQKPSAPDDNTRYYIVRSSGDDATPGLSWDVQLDKESATDYVKVIYQHEVENDCDTPTPTSGDWPTEWYRSHANCTSYQSGSEYWFRIKGDGTERNPYADYLPPDGSSGYGIDVVEGQRYFFRCRAYLGAYVSGTARISVLWYDAGGTQLAGGDAYDILKDCTAAAATEYWYEKSFEAPSGAAYGKLRIRWTGKSEDGTTSLFVRNVEFRQFIPADTNLYLHRPSTPPTDYARTAEIDVGRQTEAGAQNAADQYLLYHGEVATGSVSLSGAIEDVNGRSWPLSHVRAWDWIECPDYIDSDVRGPHMITATELNGGRLTCTIGGVDSYAHMAPERTTPKARYIGARYRKALVWKRISAKARSRYAHVKKIGGRWYAKVHRRQRIPEHYA